MLGFAAAGPVAIARAAERLERAFAAAAPRRRHRIGPRRDRAVHVASHDEHDRAEHSHPPPRRTRGVRSRDVDAILDEAYVAHVGVVVDGAPAVIPFACARVGDELVLHGSTKAGILSAIASGTPLCATVTHLDGLVSRAARSTPR